MEQGDCLPGHSLYDDLDYGNPDYGNPDYDNPDCYGSRDEMRSAKDEDDEDEFKSESEDAASSTKKPRKKKVTLSRSGPAYNRIKNALNHDKLPDPEDVQEIRQNFPDLGKKYQPIYEEMLERFEQEAVALQKQTESRARRREQQQNRRDAAKAGKAAKASTSTSMAGRGNASSRKGDATSETGDATVENGDDISTNTVDTQNGHAEKHDAESAIRMTTSAKVATEAAGDIHNKGDEAMEGMKTSNVITADSDGDTICYRDADFEVFSSGQKLLGIALTMAQDLQELMLRFQQDWEPTVESMAMLERLKSRDYYEAVVRVSEPFLRGTNPIMLVPGQVGDLTRLSSACAASVKSLQEIPHYEQVPDREMCAQPFSAMKLLAVDPNEYDRIMTMRQSSDNKHPSEETAKVDNPETQVPITRKEDNTKVTPMPEWLGESACWEEQFQHLQGLRAAAARGDIQPIDWKHCTSPLPPQHNHLDDVPGAGIAHEPLIIVIDNEAPGVLDTLSRAPSNQTQLGSGPVINPANQGFSTNGNMAPARLGMNQQQSPFRSHPQQHMVQQYQYFSNPMQGSHYPVHEVLYPNQETPYPSQQTSYSNQQMTDANQRPIYPNHQPMYQTQQPTYPNHQPMYQTQQPIYSNQQLMQQQPRFMEPHNQMDEIRKRQRTE